MLPMKLREKLLRQVSRTLVMVAVCLTASQHSFAQQGSAGTARTVDTNRLSRIDRVVADGLRRGNMPGCVVRVGHQGEVIYEKAYGYRQVKPEKVSMTVDTVFDLASLTKPIGTATSILKLSEEGLLDLNAPASMYLPNFNSHGKDKITIKQLLTHQGGLIPDNSLKDYLEGRETAFAKINDLSLRADPGKQFIYSDVGFIVLGELIEKISGMREDEYTTKNIFQPLKMTESGYLPNDDLKQRAATTQERNGAWMQGEVHDPRAYEMDGVAGHAGLFSTAQDLSRYAQMVLNRGELDGVRILETETVAKMIAPVQVSSGIRSLGWDKQTGYSSNKGDLLSDQAIGHGGFTGTVLWIDPEQQLYVIFLSNRVHPDGKGSVNSIAGRIATIAAAALQ